MQANAGPLLAIMLALVAPGALAQDGSPGEILKVMDRAQHVPEKDALELLHKSLEMAHQAPLTPGERRDLARRFIKVLQDRKFTMDQLDRLLSAKAKRQIARQISYRRSVEQWHVMHPLAFRMLWDCPKGQDPALRAIQVVTP